MNISNYLLAPLFFINLHTECAKEWLYLKKFQIYCMAYCLTQAEIEEEYALLHQLSQLDYRNAAPKFTSRILQCLINTDIMLELRRHMRV